MSGRGNTELSRRQRLLVIDDELAMLDTLSTFLTWEGYEVATASSGEEAVERAKGEPFDLAITDLRMPGMDGYETLAALKRIEPDLPVIVVTAYVSEEAQRRCASEGAFRVVRKPVAIDELLRLVEAGLKHKVLE